MTSVKKAENNSESYAPSYFHAYMINGIVKIIEGHSSMGKVLIEENVEIQPCTDNINVFSKFKFSKNVLL